MFPFFVCVCEREHNSFRVHNGKQTQPTNCHIYLRQLLGTCNGYSYMMIKYWMLYEANVLIAFLMRKAMWSPNGNNVWWLLFHDGAHQSFDKNTLKIQKWSLCMVTMKCSSSKDPNRFPWHSFLSSLTTLHP